MSNVLSFPRAPRETTAQEPSGASEPPPANHSAFVIGRDAEGHWVALETSGHSGGWFRSRDAALRYATFETDHRVDAVRVVSEPLALRL